MRCPRIIVPAIIKATIFYSIFEKKEFDGMKLFHQNCARVAQVEETTFSMLVDKQINAASS